MSRTAARQKAVEERKQLEERLEGHKKKSRKGSLSAATPQFRRECFEAVRDIVATDIDEAMRSPSLIEDVLWKTLWYPWIAELRERRAHKQAELASAIAAVAAQLFELAAVLNAAYSVDAVAMSRMGFQSPSLLSSRRLAIVKGAAGAILAALGDTLRYRAATLDKGNSSAGSPVENLAQLQQQVQSGESIASQRATYYIGRQVYLAAARLLPHNGRLYFLAGKCIAQGGVHAEESPEARLLGATYYYVRALLVRESYVGARDVLTRLFESIRGTALRQSDPVWQSLRPHTTTTNPPTTNRGGLGTQARTRGKGRKYREKRTEVWLKPHSMNDSQTLEHTYDDEEEGEQHDNENDDYDDDDDDDDDDDGNNATDPDVIAELRRHWVLSGLYLCAMLGSHVGMEHFAACFSLHCDTLHQLARANQCPPLALFRLLTLFLWIIQNHSSSDSASPYAVQSTAVVCVTLTTLIQCPTRTRSPVIDSIDADEAAQDGGGLSSWLAHRATVGAAASVWAGWMVANRNFWMSVFRSAVPSTLAYVSVHLRDFWPVFRRYCVKEAEKDGSSGAIDAMTTQWEDSVLRGVGSLRGIVAGRRGRLREWQRQVCGDDAAMRGWMVASEVVVPVRQEIVEDDEEKEAREKEEERREERVEMAREEGSNGGGAVVATLVHEKQRLLEAQRARESRKETVAALVDRELNQCTEVLVMRVVVDTNCFLSQLGRVEELVGMRCGCVVTVPLVVANELRGLSRGREGDDAETNARRVESALAALAWLARAHEAGWIEVVGAEGELLDSIAYCPQEQAQRTALSNDDAILDCCRLLDAHHASTAPVPTTSVRRRHCVLITDDRNLRVKALACDQPTRTLRAFLKWWK